MKILKATAYKKLLEKGRKGYPEYTIKKWGSHDYLKQQDGKWKRLKTGRKKEQAQNKEDVAKRKLILEGRGQVKVNKTEYKKENKKLHWTEKAIIDHGKKLYFSNTGKDFKGTDDEAIKYYYENKTEDKKETTKETIEEEKQRLNKELPIDVTKYTEEQKDKAGKYYAKIKDMKQLKKMLKDQIEGKSGYSSKEKTEVIISIYQRALKIKEQEKKGIVKEKTKQTKEANKEKSEKITSGDMSAKFKSNTLKDFYKKIPVISNDETRPFLQGVYRKGDDLAMTDGRNLLVVKVDDREKDYFKDGEITNYKGEEINGSFPDYQRVIDKVDRDTNRSEKVKIKYKDILETLDSVAKRYKELGRQLGKSDPLLAEVILKDNKIDFKPYDKEKNEGRPIDIKKLKNGIEAIKYMRPSKEDVDFEVVTSPDVFMLKNSSVNFMSAWIMRG